MSVVSGYIEHNKRTSELSNAALLMKQDNGSIEKRALNLKLGLKTYLQLML